MTLPIDFDVIDGISPDPNKPLILLLHGFSGAKADMVNPLQKRHHFDFMAPFEPARDLGWSYYPHIGPYSFSLDRFKSSIKSWRQFLRERGYRTAAYSQTEPTGFLAAAVQELAEVVAHLRDNLGNPRIVLLAHSRGGLLARRFLKENAANPGLIGSIVGCITLHTPHRGSNLANYVVAINAWLDSLQVVQPLTAIALQWLRNMVNAPGFQQLTVNGTFLNDLQASEKPIPGVAYATFGGNSVRYSRVLQWWYNWEGAVPQWNWPPYHLVINQSELPVFSPVATNLVPPTPVTGMAIPELVQGLGDLLTTDNTSRLPFAAHRTNQINHAEALWDQSLQEQVFNVLQGIRRDGELVREASAAPVYVIFGGAKFWIPNPTVLQSFGGWAAVKVVPDLSLAPVPSVPRDGTVLREMSSAPVYVMRSGQKSWIPNPDVLQKYGGWAAVKVVPDGALAPFPDGPQAT